MRKRCLIVLTVFVVTGSHALAQVAGQPAPVPRLTERTLDKASYVELARQWKEYVERNGETAEALVNLGMAYDYSGEEDAALAAARRAARLGPDDPRALAFLGKMLSTYAGDRKAAVKVLERCRKIAPDYGYGLTMLAAAYLQGGELGDADGLFKTIYERRIISRPLQDYAYNMLVGLPRGAVFISAGDNDTFPALALQNGMDFRSDVIVLNRSLLNLPEYAESQFKRHPAIRPEYNVRAHKVKMVDGHPALLSHALIAKLIEEKKAPVYLTASAAADYMGYEPEVHVEGMNMRATKKGLSAEESAQLFLRTYRLDSATDWTVAWSLAPNEAKLLGNYVTAMIRLAETNELAADTRKRLLEKAGAIADFHAMDRMSTYIRTLRER